MWLTRKTREDITPIKGSIELDAASSAHTHQGAPDGQITHAERHIIEGHDQPVPTIKLRIKGFGIITIPPAEVAAILERIEQVRALAVRPENFSFARTLTRDI